MTSLKNATILLAVLLLAVVGISLLPFAADAAIRQANALLVRSDHGTAHLIYRYFHMLGNGAATNNLGVLYLRGIGVKRDRDRAIALFEAAVAKDIVQARYNRVLTQRNPLLRRLRERGGKGEGELRFWDERLARRRRARMAEPSRARAMDCA